jgi:hypothetical protein
MTLSRLSDFAAVFQRFASHCRQDPRRASMSPQFELPKGANWGGVSIDCPGSPFWLRWWGRHPDAARYAAMKDLSNFGETTAQIKYSFSQDSTAN